MYIHLYNIIWHHVYVRYFCVKYSKEKFDLRRGLQQEEEFLVLSMVKILFDLTPE